MGYDVNYNALDYAQAAEVCHTTYAQIQQVESLLIEAAVRADLCQDDVSLQCFNAGVSARGYNVGILADLLRSAAAHAKEALNAGHQITERVGEAMQNYEVAEASVEQLILNAGSAGIIANFLLNTQNNGKRPPTETMETMLRWFIAMMPPFLFGGPNMSFNERVKRTTEYLSKLLIWLNKNHEKEIVLTGHEEPETVQVEGNLYSYYQFQEMLEPDSPEDNDQFLIVKVGENKYAVIIPGTQDGKEHPTPWDEGGIADGFWHESENFVGPINEALEISGAKEGDEIILSGYSQGGIHVAQLMKNKFLKRKYKMEKMITLGSPIGNIDLPEDVRSLSVEDQKDMVPGLDGRPNKHKENQFTTTFDGPREQLLDQIPQDGLFGPPHNLMIYGDHLRELDEAPTPEIREHLEGFHFSKNLVEAQRFSIQRKEKQRPKLSKEEEQRIERITPPH